MNCWHNRYGLSDPESNEESEIPPHSTLQRFRQRQQELQTAERRRRIVDTLAMCCGGANSDSSEVPTIEQEGQGIEMEEFSLARARRGYQPTFTGIVEDPSSRPHSYLTSDAHPSSDDRINLIASAFPQFSHLQRPESTSQDLHRETELRRYHRHLGTTRCMTDSEEDLYKRRQRKTEMLQQDQYDPVPADKSDISTARWVAGYSIDCGPQQPGRSPIEQGKIQFPREVKYVSGKPKKFEEVLREIAVHIVGDTVGDPFLLCALSKCPRSHQDPVMRRRMRKAVMLATKPSLCVKGDNLEYYVKPVMKEYTKLSGKWDHAFETALCDWINMSLNNSLPKHNWTVVGLVFHLIQHVTWEIMKSDHTYDFKEHLYTSVIDACYWAFETNRTLVSRYLPSWTQFDHLWNEELK